MATTVGGNVKELCTAAAVGDLVTIKYHLDMGMDPNFQHPEFMTTPLIEAARFGHVEAVALLLQRGGADPTIVADWEQTTPLQEALKEKHHQVVDVLLQYLPNDNDNSTNDCLVVCLTGTADRLDLAAYILSMGHCVVMLVNNDKEESSNDMERVSSMAEKIKLQTGNKKLWILPPLIQQSSAVVDFFTKNDDSSSWRPTRVDVCLHKTKARTQAAMVEELNESLTLAGNLDKKSQWKVPFRGNKQKVLVVLNSKMCKKSIGLTPKVHTLVLEDNSRIVCSTIVDPTTWWNKLFNSVWRKSWHESVWDHLILLHQESNSSQNSLADIGSCKL